MRRILCILLVFCGVSLAAELKLTKPALILLQDAGAVEVQSDGQKWLYDKGECADMLSDLTGTVLQPNQSVKNFTLRAVAKQGSWKFRNVRGVGLKSIGGAHFEALIVQLPADFRGAIEFTDCVFSTATIDPATRAERPSYGMLLENGSFDLIRFVNTKVSWHAEFDLKPGCRGRQIEISGDDVVAYILDKGAGTANLPRVLKFTPPPPTPATVTITVARYQELLAAEKALAEAQAKLAQIARLVQ